MAKLKTNKTVSTSQSRPVKPPKKGVLGLVLDVVKNPRKYKDKDNREKYVEKVKPTKVFNVSDPVVYKDRAKRYNDSLSNYSIAQKQRAKTKKNTIDAINNYNKNKNFYEPKVEYGGEKRNSGWNGGPNSIRHTIKNVASSQAHADLWFNSNRAFYKDEKGNYPGRNLLGNLSKMASYPEEDYRWDEQPKPEYRPIYTPKKAKSTVTKPKTVKPTTPTKSINKSTAPAKSNNGFKVMKTSTPTVAPKPTVKPVTKPMATKPTAKPVVKDTVSTKPVVKPVVKPTVASAPKPAVSNKPSQNVPTIKSSNNYGDTGMVNRGSYKEVKTKMAPKKGPSQFKTVKKNYK